MCTHACTYIEHWYVHTAAQTVGFHLYTCDHTHANMLSHMHMQKKKNETGMVVHANNPSTRETEAQGYEFMADYGK